MQSKSSRTVPAASTYPTGMPPARTRFATPSSCSARRYPTQRHVRDQRPGDPIRHLIGSAIAWGGNPENEATYLNVTPPQNDGKTVYRLTFKDVPVDGFWSISVYNAEGYFQPNNENVYTLNNLTARKSDDGSVTVQFGGCEGRTPNCLPIVAGWNYIVRLYRPHIEVLNGTWSFPPAEPVR